MKTKLHNHVSQCVCKIENEYNDILTLYPKKHLHEEKFSGFIQIGGDVFWDRCDEGSVTNIGGLITINMCCGSCDVDQKSIYEKYGYELIEDTECHYIKDYDWGERNKIADEVEAIVIAICGENYANTFMSDEESTKAWEEQSLQLTVKLQEEYMKKLKKKQLNQAKWSIIILTLFTILLLLFAFLYTLYS